MFEQVLPWLGSRPKAALCEKQVFMLLFRHVCYLLFNMQTNVGYILCITTYSMGPFLGYVWQVRLKPKVKDIDSKLTLDAHL